MRILHACCICGEIENQEDAVAVNVTVAIHEDVMCDACEMEAVAEAEAFGLPTSDVEGDLAVTMEQM